MKIAIVTLYGFFNYGNRLQNYALQKALSKMGHDVTTLIVDSRLELVKAQIKKFIFRSNEKIELVPTVERLREKNIKFFSDSNIHTRILVDKSREFDSSLEKDFDCFVVGSDQVWNPLFWEKEGFEHCSNNYLLRFVSKKKKISYAASFGVPDIDVKYYQLFKSTLSSFDIVTLREEAGARLIDKIAGIESKVVLDPTMLLTAEEWRSIERGDCQDQGKYILLYFLGKQPDNVYKGIYGYAQKHKTNIIDMMDPSNKFYTYGPEAFVELIDKAYTCFTDSFHATVFSILFHTPFITYERNHANNSDMNSRIDTILDKMFLKDRMYKNDDSIYSLSCDFSKIDGLLEKQREESMTILSDAIIK